MSKIREMIKARTGARVPLSLTTTATMKCEIQGIQPHLIEHLCYIRIDTSFCSDEESYEAMKEGAEEAIMRALYPDFLDYTYKLKDQFFRSGNREGVKLVEEMEAAYLG